MDNNEVQIAIPAISETLVQAQRNGMLEILSVNEALLSFEHSPLFPWHLSIVIQAKNVAEGGMPAPAEADVLNTLCDQIDKVLLDARTANGAINALFLVRSTWNGFREMEYYVHDGQIAHKALQAFIASQQSAREWNYTLDDDPAWDKANLISKLLP